MGCYAIFGSNSPIAQALCKILATQGHELVLLTRDVARSVLFKNELSENTVKKIIEFDACKFATHSAVVKTLFDVTPKVDGVFIFFVTVHSQAQCELDWNKSMEMIECNFSGTISLVTHLVTQFETQRSGFISFISSVAGDRGRKSNYLYGATKTAVNTFMSGLRARLHAVGIFVQVVKLGPTDTPLTKLSGKKAQLVASPERVAAEIWKSIEWRKEVVYVPWFWKYIMLVIKCIPERIFKRLNI